MPIQKSIAFTSTKQYVKDTYNFLSSNQYAAVHWKTERLITAVLKNLTHKMCILLHIFLALKKVTLEKQLSTLNCK